MVAGALSASCMPHGIVSVSRCDKTLIPIYFHLGVNFQFFDPPHICLLYHVDPCEICPVGREIFWTDVDCAVNVDHLARFFTHLP